MTLLWSAGLLLLGLSGFACYRHFSFSSQLARCRRSVEREEGQGVLSRIQELVEKRYANVEAHYCLYRANRQAGLLHRAIQELEMVITMNDKELVFDKSQLARELADCYVESGDYRTAQGVLLVALKKSPLDFSLLVQVSDIFINRGMGKHAAEYLDMALKIDPGNPDMLLKMARLQEKIGDTRKALAYARRVLDVRRDDLGAMEMIARLYVEFSNYAHAEQFYRDMVSVPGGRLLGLNGQAHCRLAQGDRKMARKFYRDALGLLKKDDLRRVPVLYQLGILALEDLEVREGVAYLEEVVRLKPDYEDAAASLEEYRSFSVDNKLASYAFSSNEAFLDIAEKLLEQQGVMYHKYKVVKKRDFVFYAALRDEEVRENVYIYFCRNLKPMTEWMMREIISEIRIIRMKRGIIFSSGGFTAKAEEYASSRPVELMARNDLATLLRGMDVPGQSVLEPARRVV